MATRQELYTAIGLIRHTCRVNAQSDDLVAVLQGLIELPTIELGDSELPSLFEYQKQTSKNICGSIKSTSLKIGIFLEKTDPKFLDNGIDAILSPATREKIALDIQTSNDMSTNAESFIQASIKQNDLSALSAPFESYIPECGVDEPDPWVLFPKEINHANILHDILDAMSYELQGRNSYTGESQYLTEEQFQKLISNRLFTADIYLNHLPDSTEKQNMANIIFYVKANFNKVEAIVLGQYIDSNVPKQIMVRRWWAL